MYSRSAAVVGARLGVFPGEDRREDSVFFDCCSSFGVPAFAYGRASLSGTGTSVSELWGTLAGLVG